MSASCTSKPPQTERISVVGRASFAGVKQSNQPQILFLLQDRARFDLENPGAMMTSLKISLMAFASGSSIARLQTMIPPNGACLSVANAFSHASRRSGSVPTPQGLVCFRIATVGSSNSPIKLVAALMSRMLLKDKLLAVEFFEMFVEVAVERGVLMRIFAVTQMRIASGSESENDASVACSLFRKLPIARS